MTARARAVGKYFESRHEDGTKATRARAVCFLHLFLSVGLFSPVTRLFLPRPVLRLFQSSVLDPVSETDTDPASEICIRLGGRGWE